MTRTQKRRQAGRLRRASEVLALCVDRDGVLTAFMQNNPDYAAELLAPIAGVLRGIQRDILEEIGE